MGELVCQWLSLLSLHRANSDAWRYICPWMALLVGGATYPLAATFIFITYLHQLPRLIG